MNNIKYIKRCIEISKKGLSLASPNPSVGAVLVYNDQIIGEGYTSPFGGNHAEVNCINSVNNENIKFIKHSTLYISLEPCSHKGKTPACSLLIIEKEIKNVVIGSEDPNPLVAGKGIEMLKANDINVESNILNKDCEFINRRFYTFYRKKRPYIILKWAQTKKSYFSPIVNNQFWITNKFSKQLVHKWRTQEMSILIGKETARIDNPRLNARLYQGKNPTRIVIDRKLLLDKNLNIFNQKIKTIVFNEIKNSKLNFLEYIQIDFTKNVGNQIIKTLFNYNINSIFIEGGAYTLDYFIKNNIWDEARILTGNNELEDGIKAPKIEGKEIDKYILKEDIVKVLINK